MCEGKQIVTTVVSKPAAGARAHWTWLEDVIGAHLGVRANSVCATWSKYYNCGRRGHPTASINGRAASCCALARWDVRKRPPVLPKFSEADFLRTQTGCGLDTCISWDNSICTEIEWTRAHSQHSYAARDAEQTKPELHEELPSLAVHWPFLSAAALAACFSQPLAASQVQRALKGIPRLANRDLIKLNCPQVDFGLTFRLLAWHANFILVILLILFTFFNSNQ